MNNVEKITHWMERFKTAWISKDIDAVWALLSEDVEYWETPFQKMGKGGSLRAVWEEVLPLEDMQLTYEVYVADLEADRYGVQWTFSHRDGESAGCYLIGLNEGGLCEYFYHTAQSRE